MVPHAKYRHFLNENLTIISYDIVMSVIERICAVKVILSWRRHCYLARTAILLILTALIVEMAGCGCNQPPSENLEISTWFDLDAVRYNLAGHHTLMNDLDSTTPGYE